eukprot:955239-Amphidinium_carterae.1
MEQQRIHGYHQAMRNYENLRRQQGEQVRAYHARFLACEQQLLRLGLSSYQNESRAIKWLNGLDLPAAEQRMVLSSAGSYEVDRLLLSLELHFAGHIPPSRARVPPGKGGKGGKGGRQNAALVTEELSQHAQAQEPPPEQPPSGEPSAEPEADPWCVMEEACEALSVTAQRLRHLTQNRGWAQSKSTKGGKGKGDKGGKTGGKSGGGKMVKTSYPPTGSSTTSYPAPATGRWDAAGEQSGTPSRGTDAPRPPPANPQPRRVHATAWEQSVGQYLEQDPAPQGGDEIALPEEQQQWDAVDYAEEWHEEWGAYTVNVEHVDNDVYLDSVVQQVVSQDCVDNDVYLESVVQ